MFFKKLTRYTIFYVLIPGIPPMEQVSIHLFPVVAKFAIIRCTTSFIQKTLPAAVGRGKQENRRILEDRDP